MIDLSALVNKTVDFAYRGSRLALDLSHALFSSYTIDAGTRLLLKEVAHDEAIVHADNLLDAGCGIGVISIAMAASSPAMQVVMRDRDLLAVAFAERNCWRNGLPATRLDLDGQPAPAIEKKSPKHKCRTERTAPIIIAPGLLGEDDVFGPYDAILSNLPAKAGPHILSYFIAACEKKLLKPGGRFGFVIVNTLADMAEGWCREAGLSVYSKAATKSHTAFLTEKKAPVHSASPETARTLTVIPEEGILGSLKKRASMIEFYTRNRLDTQLEHARLQTEGFWGLPEFDTLSYQTQLACEAFSQHAGSLLVRNALVFEPGIGIAALWIVKMFGPQSLHAVSRDLLSHFAVEHNLSKSAKTTIAHHSALELEQVEQASLDAVFWFPDETPMYDFYTPAWETLARTMKTGALAVITAQTGVIARFEKSKPKELRKAGEKKKKGFSALIVQRV